LSGINFEELLSVAHGDYQQAGWLASRIQSGQYTQEQAFALSIYVYAALEVLQWQHDEGDREAVPLAVDLCLQAGNYPMPSWLLECWGNAFGAWRVCEASTLDEAFGIKRKHLKARRKEQVHMGTIVAYIKKRKDKGLRIDDGMFEEISALINNSSPDDLKIGKTKVAEIYYKKFRPLVDKFDAILKGTKTTPP